ncbi:streptophobe family protein [Streptomyces sp. NBC_00257]|uniref:streptophobe family protein n=1 Tax=unclassified Streptomyces TaxID=2593676 RepID=UPI00225B18A7|nr:MULTISPECIES: streptophobe family protein [unclassified Streptomyces]MCX5428405.1 streptophobe family protein [Streptomyces sp. NBC_00062]
MNTAKAVKAATTAPEKAAVPKGPGTVTRHILEGAASVTAAVAVMTLLAYAALNSLHAESAGSPSLLVPMVVSMAVGGTLTLSSGGGGTVGGGDAPGGGLGGLLGGAGGAGGMKLEVSGGIDLMPLTLTLVGSVVLATLFFRPLKGRRRPVGALLGARFGGAVLAGVTVFAVTASQSSGKLRLPESVTEKLGQGKGGGGGRGGQGLSKAIKDIAVDVDTAAVVVQGLVWTLVVLGIGCIAARRTCLPRSLAMSGIRRTWNPATSAVSGVLLALVLIPLTLAAVLVALSLTGREMPGAAAKAGGALLLLAPNLLAVLLTAGAGSAWQGTMRSQQGQGGGMGAMFGQGQATPSSPPRGKNVMDIAVAGIPLWAIGLALLLTVLLVCGYRTTARTPVPTARAAANALLGFHLQIAIRIGIITSLCTVLLSWLTTASGTFGISIMGMQMGGAEADLSGDWLLVCLTGSILGGAAGYAGSHLHRLRRMRRSPAVSGAKNRPGPSPDPGRPQPRTAAAKNS